MLRRHQREPLALQHRLNVFLETAGNLLRVIALASRQFGDPVQILLQLPLRFGCPLNHGNAPY